MSTFFDNNFNSNFRFDYSTLGLELSPAVQNHVYKVYSQLAQMLLISTAAAYMQITSENWIIQSLNYLSFVGLLGCLIAFSFTDETKNEGRAKMLLYGFALFKGLSIAPLVELSLFLNPSLLISALGSTAIIFASLSLSVLYSPLPSTFYITGLLMSLLSVSFWLGLVNIFLQSQAMYSFELILGLAIFSLYVVYDTQVLIQKANQGAKTYLRHCLDLYIDFVAMFVRILIILMRKDQEKQEKKKKKASR